MVVLCSVWQFAAAVVRAQPHRTATTPTTAPSDALDSCWLYDNIAIIGS